MLKHEIHIVPSSITPTRLSDYVVGIFVSITTKAGMKKAIKKALVKVDGQVGTSGRYLRGGEKLELMLQDKSASEKVVELAIEVLYEDDYLAVIVKPAGIVVSGNKFKTIENALPFNLMISPLSDGLLRPKPAHRLDYPTSGLLLIGKTSQAVLLLNKMFEDKQIQKIYHAVTMGEMPKAGELDLPIDGKESLTDFEVLQTVDSAKYHYLNLVKLVPHTGRRHQLRIHMAHIGNPIFGDRLYGEEGNILQGKGLYLHASAIEFRHPFQDETISIKQALPQKFLKIFSS